MEEGALPPFIFMGLFSGKKRVKVQSTILNLAGDIGNRPNFLKTIIFDQTMHKPHNSYSQALTTSYINGQGIKLRRVVPYSNRVGYTALTGQNKARISTVGSIDVSQLSSVLSFRLQKEVAVIEAEIDSAYIVMWADQWLMLNHPSLANSEYDADFNVITKEIDITFIATGHKFSFLPTNYVSSGEYLYVTYRDREAGVSEPLVIYGPVEEVPSLPSMVDWTVVSENTVNSVFSWVKRTTVSRDYTDGSYQKDDVIAEDIEETHPTTHQHYNKTVAITGGSITYDAYHDTTFKLVPTTVTTEVTTADYKETTVVDSFELVPAFYTNVDAVNTTMEGRGPTRIFIYRKGGGDAQLDAFFLSSTDGGDYLPFVPLKTDLDPGDSPEIIYIDKNTMPDLYDANVKLMRKVSGKSSNYDDMLAKLKESNGAKDINYAYVMFGVSINTPDTSAMVYLFKFFRNMMGSGTGDPAYISFKAAWDTAEQSVKDWNAWYMAQSDPTSPMFGLVEPGVLPYPSAPTKTVSIVSNNKFNLNYKISWNGLKLTKGTGKAKPKIKTHYGAMEKGAASTLNQTGLMGNKVYSNVITSVTGFSNPAGGEIIIYYQVDDNNWEAIHVYGLTSSNIIHDGKGTYTEAVVELDKTDESALIIPLNNAIFRSMPLVAATQMTTGCMYMIINTYQEWEKKYYQTDWFKVIIIVIVVVLSVFSGGAAAPLAGTVGGTAATAIGLTGLASIIFATVVNAIAGLVISRILTAAATAIFGEQIGLIVGAIASMVAMNAMSSFAAGQQFNVMDAFNPDSLMKLTTTVAKDFGEMYAKDTAKIMAESATMMEQYKKESDKLTQAYDSEFGNRAVFDPLKFLESSEQLYFENSDAFLQRTLMTGSDIAELSIGSISMMADIGTMLETL